MKEIPFFVVSDIDKALKIQSPCFFLEKNSWDDYGLKSTFHLYYRATKSDDVVKFGSIKIIKKEHESGHLDLPAKFGKLSAEYCSVGTSLDYYEMFKSIFGVVNARKILTSLRDCALDKKIRTQFSNHYGYKTSLLRSGQDEEMFREVERILRKKEIKRNSDFSFAFSTQIAEGDEHTIYFDFSFNQFLPHRFNVIVGKNGTGKTSFLANLARVYVGLDQVPLGYFVGDRPLFRQVIAVSYNPFDNFYLPNIRGKDRDITKNSEGFFFGYKYLGIRKRLAQDSYSLKTFPELDKEFKRALDRVSQLNDLGNFWNVLEPIIMDSSFDLELKKRDLSVLNLDFKKLSSGQKFVLLALIRLYLNTKRHSLILLDEPENHLHPAIIMRFMQSINRLLELRNSYAIVATHSPVILQETPSRYVTRLDRVFDEPQISKIDMESFGGSFNEIAESVFKLSIEDSSFDKTMQNLHESGLTVSDVEELFQGDLNLRIKSYI